METIDKDWKKERIHRNEVCVVTFQMFGQVKHKYVAIAWGEDETKTLRGMDPMML